MIDTESVESLANAIQAMTHLLGKDVLAIQYLKGLDRVDVQVSSDGFERAFPHYHTDHDSGMVWVETAFGARITAHKVARLNVPR
jgi:hypothetical protein